MNLIPIVMILPLVTAVTTLQAEFCNVRPLRYSYRNGSFTHGEPMTQCTSLPNNYLDCPPSVITDGNTGPTNFDDSIQQQPYFIWNNTRSEEILFTFPRTFNLTRIVIFFYFRYSDIGLRKLRFYLVDNDFDIATNESIDRIPGRTVGPYPSNSTMKKSSNILLTGSTSKILMQVETNKKFKMVMSEIQFCTNGRYDYLNSKSNTSVHVYNK